MSDKSKKRLLQPALKNEGRISCYKLSTMADKDFFSVDATVKVSSLSFTRTVQHFHIKRMKKKIQASPKALSSLHSFLAAFWKDLHSGAYFGAVHTGTLAR